MSSLAIIVVLYNGAEATHALWQLLSAQTYKSWHLTLVDNGPVLTPDRASPLKDDVRVTFQASLANVGFARGVNRGLQVAASQGSERFLLLNPDVTFEEDFLARLVAEWDRDGADVVAPRVMHKDEPDKAWYAGGYLDFGWIFMNRHDEYVPGGPLVRTVDFASGCCLGFSRRVLEDVGLLDESFFMYWEDADLCMRLKKAGEPIRYLTEPFLLHEGGASSGGERSAAANRLYYRSYAQILKKHFGWLQAIRTMARVLAKETGRPEGAKAFVVRIAVAMLLGLLTPSRPVPRLQAYSRRES